MLKQRTFIQRRVAMIIDFAVIVLAFGLAYFLRDTFREFYTWDLIPGAPILKGVLPLRAYLWILVMILPLWMYFLYRYGVYDFELPQTRLAVFLRILRATIMGTIMMIVMLYAVQRIREIPRTLTFGFPIIGTISLFTVRMIREEITRRILKPEQHVRNLLVVGATPRGRELTRLFLVHREWGFRLMGFIATEENPPERIMGFPVLGGLEDFSDIIRHHVVDHVVFTDTRRNWDQIEDMLFLCEEQGIPAAVAADFFNLRLAKTEISDVDGIPIVNFSTTPADVGALILKRLIDLLGASVGLLLLGPTVMLPTAILIKLTSPGPVFFRQRRSGLNGRPFMMYKFRTMVVDAEEQLDHVRAQGNEMTGPVFKLTHDPRITPFGRFLRKMSIDELPQLFNVFKGDMSIVGPRPPIPEEVEQYERWQKRRLSMKPGLTCIWQVNGRNNIDFDEWMDLDLEYIDSWSLALDMKLILQTVPVVLMGTGK